MKYTFNEFHSKSFYLDHEADTYDVEKIWVRKVEQSIRSGYIVPDRILNSHPYIYFDQTGHAHNRRDAG